MAPNDGLRIVSVRTVRARRYPRLLFIQIQTESGICGLGETYEKAEVAEAAIHTLLAPALVGRDATRIREIHSFLDHITRLHGNAGAEMRAISGIDLALWDLNAKALGVPVHRMLGGAIRDSVRTYNTCGVEGAVNDRDRFLSDPRGLAAELADEGYTGMKFWPFDNYAVRSTGQWIAHDDLRAGAAVVEAAREGGGEGFQLFLEGHGKWAPLPTRQIAEAVQPYRPGWLEDFVIPERAEILARLRQDVSIPVCASEMTLSRYGFADLLSAGAMDIAMPDLAWCGGITDGLSIAAQSEAWGVPIALHNCGGPVLHAASLHFSVAVRNVFIVESVRAYLRAVFAEIVDDFVLPQTGEFPIPPGPGLGTELSEKFLARDDLIVGETTTGYGDQVAGAIVGDRWGSFDLGGR